VSSDDGLSSCEVQYDLCRAFVESQHSLGWTLVDERFDDDGVSGATLNRPALQHLLVRIRDRQVDQIVVHRLDRLARSLIGCVSLVEEFRRYDTRLVIVTAPELGCAAQDNLVFNILASFAQFEREMIASRIAETRAQLKARGQRIAGAVPYGYDADPQTKQLIVNKNESGIVKWMFEAAAGGQLPAAIADAANRRGGRTKATVRRRTANQRGGNLWTARQVVATLSNPVYLGSFKDGADVRIGHHEPIVGHDVFAAAAAQLHSRRTRAPGRRYQIAWPLKGRIQCAACARPMSPHTIRHGACVYRYYRCRSTAGGQPPCGRQVSAHAIEIAVQQNLWLTAGVSVELNQLRAHVESVVYDYRDESIRAKLIVPDALVPEAVSEGAVASLK